MTLEKSIESTVHFADVFELTSSHRSGGIAGVGRQKK
jgi:hypothetical protein